MLGPILNMIHYYNTMLIILIYLVEDLIKKSLNESNIILYNFTDKLYDYQNSICILYLTHNIQIHTIVNNIRKDRIIYIYHNHILKSSVKLINEKNNSIKNRIILTIHYIDKFYLYHCIMIYNYGVVQHETNFFRHYYNCIGEKRIHYSIV
jgi:hypothetical protein